MTNYAFSGNNTASNVVKCAAKLKFRATEIVTTFRLELKSF